MNFEKALRILGLNSNFTEEELKKAHRVLVNKYHPDRNKSPEAEEKMKEINEAREYLAKYLKDVNLKYNTNNSYQKNYNNNQNNTNLYEYRKRKAREFENITKFDLNKYNVSENIKKFIMKIDNIFFDFAIKLVLFDTHLEIEKSFDENLSLVKKVFTEIKEEFYRETNINESDVKETINYDCTLTEFYNNLLKIRDKYGKETIITDLLEKEIEKYKTYAGYDEIADRIEDCTNDTFNKIKNNNFNYTQKDIDVMHIQIEQIFKTYYILIKKIKELEKIVNTIENQEIKNYYKVIERNFYGGIPYSEFDEHIKELEKMIDKYNKENQKKTDFKKNEQQINQIYQSLITRYSDETKKYNIIMAEQSQFDIQLNLLKELLELFIKGCQEFKDLEYFSLFNVITFTDIENDNKIKEIIVKNSNQNNSRTSKSKIYIDFEENRISECESFFYLDQEKNTIYQISYSFNPIIFYERKYYIIGDHHISLEEFLDKATFIGENKVDINMNIYAVIYEMDDYLLCIKDDKFCIKYRAQLYKTSDKKYIHLDVYKDKNYLIDLIEKQIEQTIEEQEKKKETQNQQSNPSKQPDKHKHYSAYVNDKFYENVFGKEPLNTDDTYGYNNSGKRR